MDLTHPSLVLPDLPAVALVLRLSRALLGPEPARAPPVERLEAPFRSYPYKKVDSIKQASLYALKALHDSQHQYLALDLRYTNSLNTHRGTVSYVNNGSVQCVD